MMSADLHASMDRLALHDNDASMHHANALRKVSRGRSYMCTCRIAQRGMQLVIVKQEILRHVEALATIVKSFAQHAVCTVTGCSVMSQSAYDC